MEWRFVCWVISVSNGFVGGKNATHEYDKRVFFVTNWLYWILRG